MQLLRTHAPAVGQTAAAQGDGEEDGAESEWVEYVDPETGHPYYLNVVSGGVSSEPAAAAAALISATAAHAHCRVAVGAAGGIPRG